MKTIRLKYSFSLDHCEIPAETIITIPDDLANDFIVRGVAEMAEPERATVAPEETREQSKPTPRDYRNGDRSGKRNRP